MTHFLECKSGAEVREHYRAVRGRVDQWKPHVREAAPIVAQLPKVVILPQEPEPIVVYARPSVHRIVGAVCEKYRISRTDLISERRTANVMRPRQIAMYLAKQLTLRSLKQIGQHMGHRDHTTVLHGVNKITALRAIDADLDAELTALERLLGGAG